MGLESPRHAGDMYRVPVPSMSLHGSQGVFLGQVTDDSPHPRTSQRTAPRMAASGASQLLKLGCEGPESGEGAPGLEPQKLLAAWGELCRGGSGLEVGLLKVSGGKRRVGQQEKWVLVILSGAGVLCVCVCVFPFFW